MQFKLCIYTADVMRRYGLSVLELESRTGLHRTFLYKIRKRPTPTSLDTVAKLAHHIGCAPHELIVSVPQGGAK